MSPPGVPSREAAWEMGGGVETLTFGCRLNAAESAAIRALAGAAGHGPALVVNTCAVTAEAERQARQAIRRAHRDAPLRPVVVTGCAAQIAPAAWAALPGVARVVGNPAKLRPETWGGMPGGAAPAMPPPERSGRARATVQVQQGCDHACTYCVIPAGRGAARSRPAAAVAAELRALAADGYREAVLTGVDLASWGADLPGRPRLGALCRALLAAVPELPRLRLSSLDPAALDADLWALLAEEPRLMPHLHLSLQHGHDLILARMRRRHRRADVLALAARARALRPGIALGADLIAGFPTETEEHVRATLDLVEAAGIDLLHVFPYSERPGTAAARMPAVPVAVRRERAARLRAAGAAAQARFHRACVGGVETVLMERGGRGRTERFAALRPWADAGGDGADAAWRVGELRAFRVVAVEADGLVGAPLSGGDRAGAPAPGAGARMPPAGAGTAREERPWH